MTERRRFEQPHSFSGDLPITDRAAPTTPCAQSLIIQGLVIQENQVDRTIDFPTANLVVEGFCPADYGVYVTVATLDDGRGLEGVSNLSVKPTIGSPTPLLEVHIFDFDENIYGRLLTATLLRRLRPEQKFSSVDALRTQLALDRRQARLILQEVGSPLS